MLNQLVYSEGHIESVTLKVVCPLQVMVSKYSVGPATHSATATIEAFNWSTLRMTKLVSLLKSYVRLKEQSNI